MDVDNPDCDGEEEGEEPMDGDDVDEIRYIDLKAHSALAIPKLKPEVKLHGDKAVLIARDEYDLFMDHAMSRLKTASDESYPPLPRFFVTGQPGIGKWFGTLHWVLRSCVSSSNRQELRVSLFPFLSARSGTVGILHH